MPRLKSTTRHCSSATCNLKIAKSSEERSRIVIDLIEGSTLPMFLRMALSDALYEAALLKKIPIFIEQKGKVTQHDPKAIARLIGISADLFRTLQPSGMILPEKKKQRKEKPKLNKLSDQLEKLERVPENEAERFKLETEIYRIERKTEEWPDIIAA